MEIGIISDTHDNIYNLQTALDILQGEGVRTVLHCGDVCSPEMIWAMAGFDVWIAQGNLDRTSRLLGTVKETFGHERLAWLQSPPLNGYAVAMLHGDNEEVLASLIRSGEYAYVFHGHTHLRRDQTVGRTHVINPGALGGRQPERRCFCILDVETGKARFVEV